MTATFQGPQKRWIEFHVNDNEPDIKKIHVNNIEGSNIYLTGLEWSERFSRKRKSDLSTCVGPSKRCAVVRYSRKRYMDTRYSDSSSGGPKRLHINSALRSHLKRKPDSMNSDKDATGNDADVPAMFWDHIFWRISASILAANQNEHRCSEVNSMADYMSE